MENILCDTTTSLTPALDVLRASNVLILDCEGDELGKQGGTLSMIVLRTTSSNPPPQTYLIDVTRLSSSDLRPVYDLLESEAATKVVFDGRMDYSALFHEKSVDTKKVLDMQLADVRSRIVRGEDQEGRLERLRGFIHWPDVKGQPDLYKRESEGLHERTRG
uniref:3'-5' exonuclease domain-containing protein n=1 Tax=Moniliophthora roreri TaxID=221103 RepID=A0A0W0GAY2_MONRR